MTRSSSPPVVIPLRTFIALASLPLLSACPLREPIAATPLEGVDLLLRAEARLAGDINGDGFDDVLVWNDARDPSRVAVIFGRPDTGEIDLAALMSGDEGLVIDGQWADPTDGSCSGGQG